MERPRFAGGGWLSVEEQYSSAIAVADTLDERAEAWWVTNAPLGWEREVGGAPLGPFVAVNNLFDRRYASSVAVNASFARYYEPAPRRSLYAGLSLGAGR